MRRNDQNSTSGQIFNPKFEIPMSCFIVEYEFWWRDLYVLERKTVFRNAKFRHLGASGGGGDFLTKPPKGTSLADFTRFEPLIVQIRSRYFSLGEPTKQGTLQKVTERLYFTYLREFPPNEIQLKLAFQ